MVIYHYSKCKKSRAALKYLVDKSYPFEIRKLTTENLNFEELFGLLKKLNMKPFELVRTKDKFYKNELKYKEFTDNEWIETLIQHPHLIKRPIVTYGEMAVIAEITENIEKILDI